MKKRKAGGATSDVRSLEIDVASLLTPDRQFIVGEYKLMNYFMAFFFLALFGVGLYDAIARNFRNIDYQSYVFALAIIPFVFIIRKLRMGKVYIRINSKGIYQDERLVTPWSGLLNAALTQEEKKRMIEMGDKFILQLDYRKPGETKSFRRKIPLTNTQNKSEEEVLAAVRYFWVLYNKSVVV
ncbi:MAG: hypothetical protein HZA79_04950 [Sphingobacteriales bacterium]|nr:hypothetical protein [Sphingobacteriales bacterium]